jgi:hypothetical protein
MDRNIETIELAALLGPTFPAFGEISQDGFAQVGNSVG